MIIWASYLFGLESLFPGSNMIKQASCVITIQEYNKRNKEDWSEHDELDAKFFEERAALEAKNQKLYAPLYSKRYDIVTGAVEVDGAKEEDAMDQTDDTAKGVPEFWLTAMKNNKIMAEEYALFTTNKYEPWPLMTFKVKDD
ncbi:nucleosome assembly protein 1;4-like protein isoform X2 [Tanacetum coccineum]